MAHDGYGRAARRLLPWALGVVAAGVLCFGASGHMMIVSEVGQKSDRAQLDISNIHLALKVYRDRKGAWPPEDRWSEVLVAAQLLEREPLDPWGRPYLYRLENPDGGDPQPVVTCIGRDGVAGTDDDLSLPSRSEVR